VVPHETTNTPDKNNPKTIDFLVGIKTSRNSIYRIALKYTIYGKDVIMTRT